MIRSTLNAAAPRHAFSLIELLIVLAIIALLIAILLPVLANVRNAGRTTACLAQSRQIATAVAAFAADNRGRLPENRTMVGDPDSKQHVTWRWRFLEAGYVEPPEAWVCPAHPAEPLSELGALDRQTTCVGDTPSSYAINGHLLWREVTLDDAAVRPDVAVRRPSHTILIAETRAPYPDIRITNALIAADTADGGGVFGYWHAGEGVYSFQDGHAETINLMDTGSPDCRWHNGPDYDTDPYDAQTPAEQRTHDHPDWVYLANPVYLQGR